MYTVYSLIRNFLNLLNLDGMGYFFKNCITLLRPWYHQFGNLGIWTPQFVSGNYRYSQQNKDYFILPLIDETVKRLGIVFSGKVRIVDLFAADSYYGFHALTRSRNSTLTAVDLLQNSGEGSMRTHVADQAFLIAKVLGVESRFRFLEMSVFDFNEAVDLIINTGGLYHVENPELLLSNLNKISKGFMILQTVVHEDKNMNSFFESPAPNWTWGSRFSVQYLREMLSRTGWEILDEHFNLLEGNTDPKDRGSVYMVCSSVSKP
jgi:hypothetical protein